MKYRVIRAPVVDSEVELPTGAIPLSVVQTPSGAIGEFFGSYEVIALVPQA